MNLKQLSFTFTLFVFSINNFLSQGIDRTNFCSHNQEIYDAAANSPVFKRALDSVNQIQQAHARNFEHSTLNRAGTIYYIPIVYHVIHQGGVENISDAQILDDIEQLNILFRKQNASAGLVNSNFVGITADIEIEFRLAQKKNDGSCFSGITRTFSTASSGATGSARVNAVTNAHGNFPGDKYLNVFIAEEIGGAAGYTTQPWSTTMGNGIHILHEYIGRIGTSSQTGENSTLAHEAGHWLNLDHLWGGSNNPGVASNCNIDDGIGDTPNTIGWTSCNVNGSTCSSLDNVENIMEYSYCPNNMFTNGQRNMMRAAITSPVGGRSNVISASNHSATGIFDDILCAANLSAERTITCENAPIQFHDNSYHNATSWSWSFPGGTPSTSNVKNPVITYSGQGDYDVSLTVTNASGTKSITKTQYIKVIGYWGHLPPYSESFESSMSLPTNWDGSTDATNNWAITNTAGYSSTNSAFIANYNNASGTTSELASATINLQGSASATLTYRYAYAKKSTTSGENVQLLISKDCGETWANIRGLFSTAPNTNSYFTPTGSQWGYHTINISSLFHVPNFRFMFRVVNGDGNNVYIDDINLNTVAGVDELTAINSFKVFPNPFNEKATINFNLNKDSEVSINLVDVLGKPITQILPKTNLTSNLNHKYEIKKNDLSRGMYFIKITVNNNTQLKRILIN